MFSNQAFVKAPGGVIALDAVNPRDPGKRVLQTALSKLARGGGDGVVVFTHHHMDHVGHARGLKALMEKALGGKVTTVASAPELPLMKWPYRASPSWKVINRLMGRSGVYSLLNQLMLPVFGPANWGEFNYHLGVERVVEFDVATDGGRRRVDLLGRQFELILTPGHSPGHLALLDQDGFLFLGDFVPGTPWLHPEPGALDAMVDSLKRLLSLPSSRVTHAVRSHCSTSDAGRFVFPWEGERQRFEEFLELIECTLDRLPRLLRARGPMTAEQLARALIRKYRRYSRFFNKFWMPPELSWMAGYLDALERRGEVAVAQEGRRGPPRFTA